GMAISSSTRSIARARSNPTTLALGLLLVARAFVVVFAMLPNTHASKRTAAILSYEKSEGRSGSPVRKRARRRLAPLRASPGTASPGSPAPAGDSSRRLLHRLNHTASLLFAEVLGVELHEEHRRPGFAVEGSAPLPDLAVVAIAFSLAEAEL